MSRTRSSSPQSVWHRANRGVAARSDQSKWLDSTCHPSDYSQNDPHTNFGASHSSSQFSYAQGQCCRAPSPVTPRQARQSTRHPRQHHFRPRRPSPYVADQGNALEQFDEASPDAPVLSVSEGGPTAASSTFSSECPLPPSPPSYAVVEVDGRMLAPGLGVEWPQRPRKGAYSARVYWAQKHMQSVPGKHVPDDTDSVVFNDDWDPFSEEEKTPPLVITRKGLRQAGSPLRHRPCNARFRYDVHTTSSAYTTSGTSMSSCSVSLASQSGNRLGALDKFSEELGSRFLGLDFIADFGDDAKGQQALRPTDYRIYLAKVDWRMNEQTVNELHESETEPQPLHLKPRLQLMIVYRTSIGEYRHYPIKLDERGYWVDCSDAGGPTFDTLRQLVCFYDVYAISRPRAASTESIHGVDVFPWWHDDQRFPQGRYDMRTI